MGRTTALQIDSMKVGEVNKVGGTEEYIQMYPAD